jgi:hypothetical protein
MILSCLCRYTHEMVSVYLREEYTCIGYASTGCTSEDVTHVRTDSTQACGENLWISDDSTSTRETRVYDT